MATTAERCRELATLFDGLSYDLNAEDRHLRAAYIAGRKGGSTEEHTQAAAECRKSIVATVHRIRRMMPDHFWRTTLGFLR